MHSHFALRPALRLPVYLKPAVASSLMLLVLWALPFGLRAQLIRQPAFEMAAREGLAQMYNFQFQAAEVIFARLEAENPNHPAPVFLRLANTWWQIAAADQDVRYDARMLELTEKCLAAATNRLKANPKDWEAEFFQFGALAFKARLLALRGSYFKAANVAIKCMPALKKSDDFKQAHLEFLFGSGVYLYYREWYSDHKPLARPFLSLFPRGNKVKGIQELETCYARPNYTQTEAAGFLLEILETEGNLKRMREITTQLYNRYPGNSLFAFFHGRALYLGGEFAESERVTGQLINAFRKVPGHEARMLGVAESGVPTQTVAKAYLFYAKAYYARTSQAAEALKYALAAQSFMRKANDLESSYAVELYLLLGQLYEAQSNVEKALENYRLAADSDENPKARAQAEARLKALKASR